MPDGPRPPDVEFDDAAAAAAVTELTSAGRVISETEHTRATAAGTANTGFRGAYADSFGEASTGLDQEAKAAIEGIDALRRTIDEAIQAAADRRREVAAAQAVWDAEDEAERRLREQYGPNIPI